MIVPSRLEPSAAEYDAYFARDPCRWSDTLNDVFACRVLGAVYGDTAIEVPETIVDLGCGGGTTVALLRKRWPHAAIEGLDWSAKALALARAREPTCRYTLADIAHYRTDQKYDLVMALGVIEHCSNPSEVIESLGQLVGPGGLVYVEVPNNLSYSFSAGHEGFRRLGGASRQFEWHLHRTSWHTLLRKASLHIVVDIVGPLPEYEFIWVLAPQQVQLSDATLRRLWRIQYLYRLYGMIRSLPRRLRWALWPDSGFRA